MANKTTGQMLSQTPEWAALAAHHATAKHLDMRQCFAEDSDRFDRFSVHAGDLLLDYSKNKITQHTVALLQQLAHAAQLKDRIEAMFTGEKVNISEKRPALHTALRNHNQLRGAANTVASDIADNLRHMRLLCEQIQQQHWVGATGKPITDVVHVGIGGSYLGPLLASDALKPYCRFGQCHFVANVDDAEIQHVLKQVNPATTLFIIASKSFKTQETLTNANIIVRWLKQHLGDTSSLQTHLIAITNNIGEATAFGIDKANTFPLWDWVGGRYSLWSAMGLGLAITCGMDTFTQLLQGAASMDQHFRETPLDQNMPVIMGLLGIWYTNFFGCRAQAVIPYHYHLRHLPAYIAQLEMESNGKSVSLLGESVDYATSPVIFGDVGTNGQHAFHQLLHQGPQFIPIDFILPLQSHYATPGRQPVLVANCLAQAQALLEGNDDVNLDLERRLAGNRPSNMLIMPKLTPHTLGALLALYEHKVYIQSAIWQINPFDQWGVELGKTCAKALLTALENDKPFVPCDHDGSTVGLLAYIKTYL